MFFVIGMLQGADVLGVTVTDITFEDGTTGDMHKGENWDWQASGGMDDSAAMRLTYDSGGTSGNALSSSINSLNTDIVWVEADMKIEGNPDGGSKWVKIFGNASNENGDTWYNMNNVTTLLHYTGGVLGEVSYNGDCICTAKFDGTRGWDSCEDDKVFHSATSAIDPRDGEYHHYKLYWKRATNNMKNGEAKVWWDDELVVHVSGLESNNDMCSQASDYTVCNDPFLNRVEFGGYTNHNTETWYLWVDNVYVGTTEKEGDIFFNDSFESGDLSYTNQTSGAIWSGSNRGGDGDFVGVSTDKAYTGQYSLKFKFGGNPDLDDDAFAEERFYLGSAKDEVYIRYYLWVPENFTVRSVSGDNNKFIRLWGDTYGDPMQVGVSYRHEGIPYYKTKSLGWNADSDLDHVPNCSGSTGLIFPGNEYRGTSSLYDMKGKWTAIETHYKRDAGSGDGAFEMWVDGVQEINKHNISWIGAPCSPGYFKNGYLLGWANSGFDEDTIFYIDDVVFSDSYIGLIDGENNKVVRADVNQDSQINTTDAMLTLRNSLGLNMSETAWQASATTGDVNCDDDSNSTDAMLLLRYLLGLNMSDTDWCE